MPKAEPMAVLMADQRAEAIPEFIFLDPHAAGHRRFGLRCSTADVAPLLVDTQGTGSDNFHGPRCAKRGLLAPIGFSLR